MTVQFQWDPDKATRNQDKHGISFLDAATVFQDPLAFIFDDEYHSQEEHRELIIGFSRRRRLLIVAFTERDNTIRIISARKADSDERYGYEQQRR